MKTQRERAEEKRQQRLGEVDRQVKSGDLVIRQMTDEERKKFPPPDPDRPQRPQRRGR